MQTGDYGEERSEPWTYRSRVMPARTWCGRVVHRRHTHFFTAADAARIMAKLQPSPKDDGETWARTVIKILKMATIVMLERILFFLSDEFVNDLYEWGIGILDRLFQKLPPEGFGNPGERRRAGISAIQHVAAEAGVNVVIKE